jgi:hypothetical protein
MLLFSFIYYLTRFLYCIKNKYINFALDLLLICSIYCLYKAGSRTTFVGFIIFSLIILWKNYKIYFYLFVTVILLIIIFKHDRVSDIIWQTKM